MIQRNCYYVVFVLLVFSCLSSLGSLLAFFSLTCFYLLFRINYNTLGFFCLLCLPLNSNILSSKKGMKLKKNQKEKQAKLIHNSIHPETSAILLDRFWYACLHVYIFLEKVKVFFRILKLDFFFPHLTLVLYHFIQ